MTKICSKCGEEKDVAEFRKGKSQCKTCIIKQHREYNKKNADKMREYYKKNAYKKREYYQKNANNIRERHRKNYKENLNNILENCREYYKKNVGKIREKYRAYYQKNELIITAKRKLQRNGIPYKSVDPMTFEMVLLDVKLNRLEKEYLKGE